MQKRLLGQSSKQFSNIEKEPIGRKHLSASIDELRIAIESQHGGTATLAQSVHVHETFEGKTVWEGVVHVFNLKNNPKATRAYAWSSPIEGSDKRRFFAVLQMGAIKTPHDAVRAAIVAEHRRPEHG